MARPRKQFRELRAITVRFRLTRAEYARLQQAAAGAAVTISDYARQLVLDRPPRAADPPETPAKPAADAALLLELRRIGVNINQAVRRLHGHGRMPPELPRLALATERLVRKILARMEGDGSQGRG